MLLDCFCVFYFALELLQSPWRLYLIVKDVFYSLKISLYTYSGIPISMQLDMTTVYIDYL